MEQMLETKKQTRFIIKIDELGRIHIPIQVRNKLNLHERDKLYIYKSGTNIILEKSNIKNEKEKIIEEKKIISNDTEVYIKISKISNCISENNKGKLRVIDELGNCVIPIEVRKELHIIESDMLKICVKDNKIILIKNCKKV